MNPSWDDGSTSMASVDLLSEISPSLSNLSNLEQISEAVEATHNHQPAAAAAAAAASSSTGTPSPMPSSLDQSLIYQLDFDVEHVGKNKPQSKRMAVWKYGIPRQSDSGNGTITVTGHEAKLTWSTHSGKYTISVDGEEIFTSIAKGSVLEHKWKWSHSRACVIEDDGATSNDDSVPMRIIACRKPPVRSSKNFRCYEFVIGGKVFRDLPLENGEDGPSFGGDFQNEDQVHDYGKLMSILDVIEPGWQAAGYS